MDIGVNVKVESGIILLQKYFMPLLNSNFVIQVLKNISVFDKALIVCPQFFLVTLCTLKHMFTITHSPIFLF